MTNFIYEFFEALGRTMVNDLIVYFFARKLMNFLEYSWTVNQGLCNVDLAPMFKGQCFINMLETQEDVVEFNLRLERAGDGKLEYKIIGLTIGIFVFASILGMIKWY